MAEPFRLRGAKHDKEVNYIAVSVGPPGLASESPVPPRVITAGEDGKCLVFEPVQGYWVVTQVLVGHEGGVYSVVMASAVDVVVSTGEDATLRVWRPEDGLLQCADHDVIRGHSDSVHFAALNRNVSLIASASRDHTCRIWRFHHRQVARWWQQEHVLRGHSQPVYGVEFSPDFTMLLTASEDCECHVWRFQDEEWKSTQSLTGHLAGLNSVRMSEDGSIILTAGCDEEARVWELQMNGEWGCTQVLTGHRGHVYDAAISDDLTLIATCGEDGTCRLYLRQGLGEWRYRQRLQHRGAIWGARIERFEALRGGPRRGAARDGARSEFIIGTGSSDKTAILWRWDGKAAYKHTHIRYAGNYEVSFRVLALAVTCLQKVRFAFQASIPWKKAIIKPITVPLAIATLDFRIGQRTTFVARSCAAVGAVLLFLVLALLKRGRAVVWCISSICYVPIMKYLAEVLACKDGFVSVLEEADEGERMKCHSGLHIVLELSAAASCLLFVLLLLPFTMAEGDLQVMPRHVWCRPREWVGRQKDIIKGLDLGRLSPSEGKILHLYAGLFAGIGLPVVDAFPELDDFVHGLVSLGLVCLPLMSLVFWPPFKDQVVSSALLCSQYMTVNAFVAGLVAICLGEPGSIAPVFVLLGGWVVIILWMALSCRLRRRASGHGTTAQSLHSQRVDQARQVALLRDAPVA